MSKRLKHLDDTLAIETTLHEDRIWPEIRLDTNGKVLAFSRPGNPTIYLTTEGTKYISPEQQGVTLSEAARERQSYRQE